MKSSIMYAALAVYFGLSTARLGHRMRPRQLGDFEGETPLAYLYRVCNPVSTDFYYNGFTGSGTYEQALANSSAPCDQQDYIFMSCIAKAGNAEVDFAAEQQCLCGSNVIDAWQGCSACWRSHGLNYTTEAEDAEFISFALGAECAPKPYPSVPFSYILNITTVTTSVPPISLGFDKFPNQTAVSSTKQPVHSSATLGEITGVATGRATARSDTFPIYTAPASSNRTSGAATITSIPTTTPSSGVSGSGIGSSSGPVASQSTAGAGDHGVVTGAVFVVVNVVVVMLL